MDVKYGDTFANLALNHGVLLWGILKYCRWGVIQKEQLRCLADMLSINQEIMRLSKYQKTLSHQTKWF
jgi:hypothetical protein